jgi:hypothetical protein
MVKGCPPKEQKRGRTSIPHSGTKSRLLKTTMRSHTRAAAECAVETACSVRRIRWMRHFCNASRQSGRIKYQENALCTCTQYRGQGKNCPKGPHRATGRDNCVTDDIQTNKNELCTRLPAMQIQLSWGGDPVRLQRAAALVMRDQLYGGTERNIITFQVYVQPITIIRHERSLRTLFPDYRVSSIIATWRRGRGNFLNTMEAERTFERVVYARQRQTGVTQLKYDVSACQ